MSEATKTPPATVAGTQPAAAGAQAGQAPARSGAVANVARPPAARVLDWDRPVSLNDLLLFKGAAVVQIAMALPGFKKESAERMVRSLVTECQKNPNLLDCTPKSLFGCLVQVAQLGLNLGGAGGQAYLIPFKREAQLVIGYKGFIQLADRSGKIRSISPRVVRESDAFDIQYGTNQRIEHIPNLKAMDAPVVGYYVAVQFTNGGTDFEFMTRQQAENHRNQYALSKGRGPWFGSPGEFDEMALKTVIRKWAKRAPVSEEMVVAAGLEQDADEGRPQSLGIHILPDPVSESDDLRNRLAGGGGQNGGE
jgi:recombination protein RecT